MIPDDIDELPEPFNSVLFWEKVAREIEREKRLIQQYETEKPR